MTLKISPERALPLTDLTPRQTLLLVRLLRLIKAELCVHCHQYRRLRGDRRCRYCNRARRKKAA